MFYITGFQEQKSTQIATRAMGEMYKEDFGSRLYFLSKNNSEQHFIF